MSIPRFAIQRPVMMAMISAIVILIGGISLTRLPVDLLPDISQPTVNVRVNYTGVGPLEMEELIVRPLEQQLSAVPGLEQMNSTSHEGNANIQLNFTWGTDLTEAMDDIRTRIDRVRGRLPEDADPPVDPEVRLERRSRSWASRSRAPTARCDRVHAARAGRERSCRRASSACPAWPR